MMIFTILAYFLAVMTDQNIAIIEKFKLWLVIDLNVISTIPVKNAGVLCILNTTSTA